MHSAALRLLFVFFSILHVLHLQASIDYETVFTEAWWGGGRGSNSFCDVRGACDIISLTFMSIIWVRAAYQHVGAHVTQAACGPWQQIWLVLCVQCSQWSERKRERETVCKMDAIHRDRLRAHWGREQIWSCSHRAWRAASCMSDKRHIASVCLYGFWTGVRGLIWKRFLARVKISPLCIAAL